MVAFRSPTVFMSSANWFTLWSYFSFHVGSGCYDPAAFSAAVKCAREMFDIARTVGYQFSLLDIGGGFPSESSATDSFDEVQCSTL